MTDDASSDALPDPSNSGSLEIEDILKRLPHRYPFVLVDRITEVVPGERISGRKMVAYNEPWFQGHFPDRPVMPGVLIVEALAQLGGVLAFATANGTEAPSHMLFLGIDKFRFRRPVTPGDALDLSVEVIHRRADVWKLRGEARLSGALCAHGELLVSA
jgi:3-hydroxyacyl-[acyl-carrier-protein] dehydratase